MIEPIPAAEEVGDPLVRGNFIENCYESLAGLNGDAFKRTDGQGRHLEIRSVRAALPKHHNLIMRIVEFRQCNLRSPETLPQAKHRRRDQLMWIVNTGKIRGHLEQEGAQLVTFLD